MVIVGDKQTNKRSDRPLPSMYPTTNHRRRLIGLLRANQACSALLCWCASSVVQVQRYRAHPLCCNLAQTKALLLMPDRALQC